METSHALQLQSLEGNPGILPIKEGTAFKQQDKWLIFKKLDLGNLLNDFNFNLNKYNEFSNLINVSQPYSYEFLGLKVQVDYLSNILIDKFQQLIPSYKSKRGLLNPLGSLIKIITGNLDNEDAIRYDSIVSELKINQAYTDKKITLISKMLDSFINSTEALHNNTLILNEKIQRIERLVKNMITKSENSIYSIYVLGMFDMFLCNFRTIYIFLNELETALALSKVSVLHQSIINSNELLNILQLISQTDNLTYEPNINNLINIESTISVKAYIKKSQITFILEVPLTDNNSYNYYRLYPIPIYNVTENVTTIVIPKYPYLMVKSSMYLPLARPCSRIAVGDQFLCSENEIVRYPEPTCIEQLMKFESSHRMCTSHVVNVEDIKIQHINTNSWIVYSKFNSKITMKCKDDDTSYQMIQGTLILTLEENCNILIENIYLYHRSTYAEHMIFKKVPLIHLPKLNSTKTGNLSTVDLRSVDLSEVKQLSHVLKHNSKANPSDIVESLSEVKTLKIISFVSLSLYISLPVLVLCYVVYKFRVKIFNIERNPQSSTPTDDFVLNGGGVMQAPGNVTGDICFSR